MKNIMYASIALLCLAVAFHLGSVTASSHYVDPMHSGVVAFHAMDNCQNAYVLDESGVLWQLAGETEWNPVAEFSSLPVAVSQLKFYTPCFVVTTDNQVWSRWTIGNDDWHYRGAWPGASPVRNTTWGKLKAAYR